MHISVLIIAATIALISYIVAGKFYKFYVFKKNLDKIPGPTFGIPHFGLIYKLMNITKAVQETSRRPPKDIPGRHWDHPIAVITANISEPMGILWDHPITITGQLSQLTRCPKDVLNKKELYRLDWFARMSEQYEDGYFRTWIGTQGSAHIRKPEHIEIICRSNTEITKSPVYDYLMPWLGRGLLTSTGSQWFHSRKLITPAFHFSILENFAHVMIDKAAIFTNCIDREIKIHGDKPFDIFELTVKAALDIICETAMGVDVHAQETIQSEYIEAVHTISGSVVYRLFRPWLKLRWFFDMTVQGKAFNKAVHTAHDLCTRVIKEKQEERKMGLNDKPAVDEITGTNKRKAFLDILLEANEKEENPLTIEEIRDQANTFMFAGHDTTGALVSWTLFCLGNDQDVQKKVHEELDEILGDADDQNTLKQLPNLKYLERVIKEVLRLYPSVTSISRKLMGDLRIGNYNVPKGTTLTIQMYQMHRDPSLWPNPLRFDPDRFLPENIRGRHPYAYIPFSAGPRNCIGQKYAMLEAKLMLAQILRKFSVKSVENHSTIKKYSEIILRPVDGIYVHMTKRSNP